MRKIVILTALMTFYVSAIPSLTYALGPNTVDSAAIIDGQVKTVDIDALAVTTGKIADGAITTGKLADWSVDSSKIIDFSVTDTKISSNAVTTSKIQDGAVTNAKISGPVDAEKIKQYTNVYTVAKGVQEGNGTYSTIQSAIDAATAAGGVYLIKVMPGQYTEDVSISGADIYLQGSGSETTEIRPATTNGPAITISNSWGYISSLSFGGNGNSKGISITDSEITIKDNTFRGASTGIFVTDSTVNVEKNTFFVYEYGVRVNTTSTWADVKIVDNSFTGVGECPEAIFRYSGDLDSNNFTIKQNKFDYLRCTSIDVRGNVIKVIGNEINGYSSPTTNSEGVRVVGINVIVSDNALKNNGSTQISSDSTTSAVIKNNIVVGDGVRGRGIDIGYSSTGSIVITNNHATGNPLWDIKNWSSVPANINFNVFDTYQGFTPSHLNVKSDGTPW